MPSTKVAHAYSNGTGHVIEMDDGSMYFLHFTSKGMTASYAPDGKHYPSMLDNQGHVAEAFDPIPNCD